MNTKLLLILFLIFTLYQKAFSQNYQNIPKGYEPYYLVSSPDSSKSINHFFWLYGNNNRDLFLQCGFGKNSDIIWLDTETWEIKKVIRLDKDVNRFYGVTQDFKTLIMEQRTGFYISFTPFFQRTKYIIIDLESGKSTVIKEKDLDNFINQNGKLHSGMQRFVLTSYILSLDKNILIAPQLHGQDIPFVRSHELAIFKYVGHKNYTRGLCNYDNLYAVERFYEGNYDKPDTPPQFIKFEGKTLQQLFQNISLDTKTKNITFDIKIAFTVNCKGKVDTFFMISEYQSFFLQSLAYRAMDIIRALAYNWQPAVKNGQNVDCIQVLDVKIVNGKIDKIIYQ